MQVVEEKQHTQFFFLERGLISITAVVMEEMEGFVVECLLKVLAYYYYYYYYYYY